MIIIAGYELVDAKKRDRYVAAHCVLVARARPFDGCIHVAITADSVDPERINSVELRDIEVMDEWRKQANAPDMEEPKHMEGEAARRHRWWPPLPYRVGECLPPAAQLRSCALSRAACRVRWSRSGRLGADRAASA